MVCGSNKKYLDGGNTLGYQKARETLDFTNKSFKSLNMFTKSTYTKSKQQFSSNLNESVVGLRVNSVENNGELNVELMQYV